MKELIDIASSFFLSFFLFFSIKTWRNQATQKMSDRHCHWALKGYADGV
jgi:hypothetical protein